MAHAVDAAILEALGLDASATTMSPHGGSGFASTFKLSTVVGGRPRHYFVKTGSGADAETMFKGEHASLNAIADAVPSFCPRSHAHGAMQAANMYFLATDFLHIGAHAHAPPSSSTLAPGSGSGLSLAAKLARLHTTPAPVPVHGGRPSFGFPVATCCGSTVQDNAWAASWADFYADRRLRGILRASTRSNGPDAELAAAVDKVAGQVVPRLLGRVEDAVPVVVHGDLWSGNHGRGRIAGQEDNGSGVEEVVFDPSAVYGHAEYDLGIMRMFGGFGPAFWDEYHRLVPKAEPRDEWEDRMALYELYHQLNHFAMFGGGYRNGAMSIMKRLIGKYAD
ncbi:fructosamine-3-kinase [Cordyceps javanica]|uniref:protein-ribulosamine 3-kinase n=1 Tax=Cordyceps javanica TaxID=43265 RepID=A0A545VY53_9HYPO|nr:fructosamine-3-kinase [Cordyceps javanica]TQW06653.1 fructosamine-3-kinase [Cordyceps javanica]